MNAALVAAVALAGYACGYLFYSRYLAVKIFELRADVKTPAHARRDDVDYVPTSPWVLFGHHFASIAGLAPMLGPAVAVIWGWLPALLWVLFGAIFVGCVHDFGSMVVSLRARGLSIGKAAEGIIGPRAKTLFHIIIFFLVALAMGVFAFVIAFLFSPPKTQAEASIHFPQAVIPSFGLMIIASIMGFLGHKRGMSWKILAPVGFALTLVLTYVAGNPALVSALTLDDTSIWTVNTWMVILLAYAFIASVMPVWTLLQPRDFLNSFLLYLGLGAMYTGFFVLQPKFVNAPVIPEPEGAPGLFPFVFIVIACGAASGFHSLVSSGTTAKQLDKETHARPVGYGGMIGESMLGLLAVLATTAGVNPEMWDKYYGSWSSMQGLGPKIGVFIQGSSSFLEALGINRQLGSTFISLVVVSFALTSLDSATRLLRYNIEEMSETLKVKPLGNRFIAGLLAIGAIAFFAFYKIDGRPAGLALWALFGTTNQLLAGLALLAITLYLLKRGKPWYFTGIPMVFLLGATLLAMYSNITTFLAKKAWPLFTVGLVLMVLAVWVVIEAILSIIKFKQEGRVIESLDVFVEPGQKVEGSKG